MIGLLAFLLVVIVLVGLACWANSGETSGKAGDSVGSRNSGDLS